MTIRVELGGKDGVEVYKNHRPEFRPTDSDKLYGSERTLAAAVTKIADAIPTDMLVDYIYGRVTTKTLDQAINDLVSDDPELLERPIFAGFQSGGLDAAEQQRRDVNAVLYKLSSPVMLRSTVELRKAKREVVWDAADLGKFDQVDPNAAGRVYSRFRSQQILTDLAVTVRTSVETTIAQAFTVAQSFTTGRTVTGLTTDQTAQALYAILDDLSAVRPTGADLAARIVPHTRGLNDRYAAAVMNHGNAVAAEQLKAGQSPRRSQTIADRAMSRYGDKLRRSRARMIARTEIAYAQNAGIQHQNDLLMQAGVVSPDSQKEWITGPFDVCNICVPLGGTRVPMQSDFSWENGSGNPPAHPNCRCKTRIVPTIDTAPQRVGAGTVDDPFRYQFADGWIAPIHGAATVSGGDAAGRLSQFGAFARSDDLFGSAVFKRDATSQRDWLDRVAPARVEDAKATGLYDKIARDGVQKPVDVFVRPESALIDGGPRFELSTGHHRLAVAHDLGLDVPVRFYGKGFAEVTGHISSRRPDGSFGLHGPKKV